MLEVIYTGLTSNIGKPRDLEKNTEDPTYFNNQGIDLSIPLSETKEYPKHIELEEVKATEVKHVERTSIASAVTNISAPNSAQKPAEPLVKEETLEEKREVMRQRVNDMIKPHDIQYTPIKSLNTFLFDWKIKARVTKKHQIRNYTN